MLTTVARGVAASGSLLLGVVLGRMYGTEGMGAFVLAQSFLFGAGIMARYGLDNALMRFVAMAPQSGSAYLAIAAKRALLLALPLALLIWLTRKALGQLFDMPELEVLLAGIALAIPAFTLTYILAGFMKGLYRPAAACFLESGYISLITGALVLLFAGFHGNGGVGQAGWALALAAWITLCQGLIQLALHLYQNRATKACAQASSGERDNSTRSFFTSSRAFFVMSMAEFMQNVLSVMLAGLLLDNQGLGLFKSAERVALLIGFILMIIAAVFPPRFAALYQQHKSAELKRLARFAALLAMLMATPLLLACLLIPGWLLGLFGQEFVAAADYLRIIALAQTINVTTATVTFLLNMTGHEALMRNIALFSGASGLLAFVISIPLFGALGAALSLAWVLVLQNLLALYFVRKRLGFWVYPAWR